MSILIKGINFPKSCWDCKFCLDYEFLLPYVCAAANKEFENGIEEYAHSRPNWCPLIEIPPHGRLIDADALGNSLENLAADKWNQKAAPINWSYAFEVCLEIVDNAPTIIEAEE